MVITGDAKGKKTKDMFFWILLGALHMHTPNTAQKIIRDINNTKETYSRLRISHLTQSYMKTLKELKRAVFNIRQKS